MAVIPILILFAGAFLSALVALDNRIGLFSKSMSSVTKCCLSLGKSCFYVFKISGGECINDLFRNDVFYDILHNRVKGFIILFEDINFVKALRELEAKIITYRVEIERNPDNLRAKRKLELMESIYKEISKYNDPVKPEIILLFESKDSIDKVRSSLSYYGCNLVSLCNLSIIKRKNLISKNKIIRNFLNIVDYDYMISSLSLNDGIIVGSELRLNSPVVLPLIDEEIGSLQTVIVGPSGRGKTTLLGNIISGLSINEQYCVVFFDPKGDLKRIVRDFELLGCDNVFEGDIENLKDVSRASNMIESIRSNNCKNIAIVIDEFWRLSQYSGFAEIIREARSKNVNLFLASQEPLDFADYVWNNVHNIIIFGSSSKEYVKNVLKYSNISEEYAQYLYRLGVGEALLKNFRRLKPILFRIQIPSITVKRKQGRHVEAGSRVLRHGQALDNTA
jgi:DNA helicase HerA-like ATPase